MRVQGHSVPGRPRKAPSSSWRAWSIAAALLAATLPSVAPSAKGQNAAATEEDVEELLVQSGLGGGLIVHAGCDDGLLPAPLAENGSFLVHGLVRDPARLDAVRADMRERGLCGRATAVVWDGRRLPYADHSVNLLLLSDAQVEMPPEELDRVLAPGGLAHVNRDGEMATYRQPWPDDIDHWTHARYDATGNPTSRDTRVGPPRYIMVRRAAVEPEREDQQYGVGRRASLLHPG